MNKRHPAFLLAGIAGAAGVLLPMAATPASATSVCNVEVTKLQNWELQDNDPQDEIKFELGDNEYGVFTFTDNQYRTNSLGHPDEDTTGSSVRFELWDKDSVVKTTIATHYLSCSTDGNKEQDFVGNGGEYTLYYTVSH
jgi:hypothetical protein